MENQLLIEKVNLAFKDVEPGSHIEKFALKLDNKSKIMIGVVSEEIRVTFDHPGAYHSRTSCCRLLSTLEIFINIDTTEVLDMVEYKEWDFNHVFQSILAHEYGHYLIAKIYGHEHAVAQRSTYAGICENELDAWRFGTRLMRQFNTSYHRGMVEENFRSYGIEGGLDESKGIDCKTTAA